MPELTTMETPKTAGFVNPKHNNRNRRRIEQEEKELEELLSGDKVEEEVTIRLPSYGWPQHKETICLNYKLWKHQRLQGS